MQHQRAASRRVNAVRVTRFRKQLLGSNKVGIELAVRIAIIRFVADDTGRDDGLARQAEAEIEKVDQLVCVDREGDRLSKFAVLLRVSAEGRVQHIERE